MKFSLKICFTLLVLLLSVSSFAQQVVLSGTVTDKEFGDPLAGANVYIVNQSNRALGGVMVNSNGEYFIRIPNQAGLKVVFSFVGFISQTIEYKGQEKLDVKLVEQSQQLKGVEVSAKKMEKSTIGLTKRQMVSATQKVDMKMLETAPVTNVADALQGALANVDILTGADPGAKSSIRIRGTSSLNASSEPLIVLNGVPFPAEIDDDFNFSSADSDDYSELLNVSPADIESIEVLKDAAATAIWGSRGANGVILINTKKGAKGKIKFQFSTKAEVRKEASTIPLLDGNQYCSLIQDAIWNTVSDQGYTSSSSKDYLDMLFNEDRINYNPSYKYFDEYNQNTDWVDEVTQIGYSLDNNFSMSGGGDKATYRLGLGYSTEEGTTIGTAYKRFSSSFNMNYKFSDNLDVTLDYRFTRGDRNADWTYSSDDTYKKINPRSMAIKKMPNESPYVIAENGSRSNQYFTPYEDFQGGWADGLFNPVAMAKEAVNRKLNYDNNLTLSLHYKFFDGFDYYGYVNMKANTTEGNQYLPSTVTGVPSNSEWSEHKMSSSTDKLYMATENKLIYVNSKLENHLFVGTASLNTSDQSNSQQSIEIKKGSSSQITGTQSGNIKTLNSGKSTNRTMGFIGNVNYTFMDRYVFNAGYRIEGNSSVGEDNRWGGFPTLGAKWRIGEEKIFKDKLPWLSLFDVKYSWGQSGNSPSGASPYVGCFSALSNGYGDMTAVYPSQVQLNKLKWETVTSNNFGIEMGFLDDMFTVGLDIYDKVTTDLLQKKYTVPTTTGYSSYAYVNSGKMTNNGWELTFGYNGKFGKDWRFTANFNISQNINEVNELPGNKLEESYSFKNGEYASKVVAGDPLGSFYGYRYKGVYQNEADTYAKDSQSNVIYDLNGDPVVMNNGSEKVYAGDAKYEDINHDGVIDKYDIVYLGNALPTLTGGVQLSVNYKNWGLSMNIHGRGGQKVINSTRMGMESMYNKNNQSTAVLRRWRNEGDNTDIPRALYNKGYNYLGSDRFVEDASFLRLKTLTLKYQFPKELVKSWSLSNLDVYLTAYDLLTLTDYTGQDPEVSTSGSPYILAKDGASTPKPIRVAFGINVKF